MASLFDMDYGTVRKGTGRLSGREVPRETPSLWDYINAAAQTPVPGVADVAAGLLAAKDFREGNYGSGALNAAGVLPFVPALGGIFKGVKGATRAEKQALLKAQQMAREGADRDTIWNATLWYKGKDGKWRTEISDEAAKYRKPVEMEGQKLFDVFEHPELKGAYPLDDITLTKTFEGGYFDDANSQLAAPEVYKKAIYGKGKYGADAYARAIDRQRSVTMHELQHAIQQREGMARGGSPENAPIFNEKELMQIRDQKKQLGIDPYRIMNMRAGGYPLSPEQQQAFAKWEELTRLEDEVLSNRLKPYEAYRRLLGEVDARNTQKRMDMTLDQRRQFAPWTTWDVPEADQIVRFGDGPSMMVAPKKLEQGLSGEPGYVYHATNADRLREIMESGKLNTHKPWEFTEQDFWPDGSKAKRAYFGKGPENLWQFAPPEGQPVVIRAKESSAKFKRESTGDIFTEKPIGAKNLEFLGDDGAWHPLVDLNK